MRGRFRAEKEKRGIFAGESRWEVDVAQRIAGGWRDRILRDHRTLVNAPGEVLPGLHVNQNDRFGNTDDRQGHLKKLPEVAVFTRSKMKGVTRIPIPPNRKEANRWKDPFEGVENIPRLPSSYGVVRVVRDPALWVSDSRLRQTQGGEREKKSARKIPIALALRQQLTSWTKTRRFGDSDELGFLRLLGGDGRK
ncbi:hypothetical protein B0H10DRAFT_1948018 [Mycena sp. CBHHK59/15]|nr:hypothetical protein B0H10DRAFT_1948018 [Mycena sp. CBHHK59/15]